MYFGTILKNSARLFFAHPTQIQQNSSPKVISFADGFQKPPGGGLASPNEFERAGGSTNIAEPEPQLFLRRRVQRGSPSAAESCHSGQTPALRGGRHLSQNYRNREASGHRRQQLSEATE
ncbi:Hypothetical_protein [Hexamita inflata]|uniref:Hypothetical_protein n=1 Tax=Hexamita inflata TaxID=28002 RepID=A0AA86R8Y4_9EUKA|nr:Hypothetical protein HINF_LOCUS57206 [Hexamita inflata]